MQAIHWMKPSKLYHHIEEIIGCSIWYVQIQILRNGHQGGSSHIQFGLQIPTSKEGSQNEVY